MSIFACTHVWCTVGVPGAHRGKKQRTPGTLGLELQMVVSQCVCGWWELNPGPPPEPASARSREPALQLCLSLESRQVSSTQSHRMWHPSPF